MSGKNIALLTGRGGSVSIKDKNIMPVLGRPLMAYPILAAKHATMLDDIYISTDGEKLKEVARQYDVKVIDRPPELALPTSQHVECLNHALEVLREQGVEVNILVVLLCNVATHRLGTIDRCIELLEAHPEADSCVTVVKKNECCPLIAKTAIKDDESQLVLRGKRPAMFLEPYVHEWYRLPESRHNMPPSYFLTHSLWALRVSSCFKPSGQQPWDFMGKNILGLPIDGGTDIHEVEEVAYSEAWLKRVGWTETSVPEAE